MIAQARADADNVLLFDNGDLLQGNPFADYNAKGEPVAPGETHPVLAALEAREFDAWTLGNHEFNYGLEFLDTALAGSELRVVSAYVYRDDGDDGPGNDELAYEPYVILEREITAEDGQTYPLSVGVIGFVTLQIVIWDCSNLEGWLITKDIVASAKRYVPELKAAGAEVVVALSHSGFGEDTCEEGAENVSHFLTEVEGIDVVIFGHEHGVFPSGNYAEYRGG